MTEELKPCPLQQVYKFLESIGGAGYGCMAEYEIAKETVRRLAGSPAQREPAAWIYEERGLDGVWEDRISRGPTKPCWEVRNLQPLFADHAEGEPAKDLAEELREYTAMKYAGDCKCGKCQLVPRALVERIYHTLNGSAFRQSPAASGNLSDKSLWSALEAISRTTFSGSEMDEAYMRGNRDAHATCARMAKAALRGRSQPETAKAEIVALSEEMGLYDPNKEPRG